ncbi:MAG TPA: SGNH/GDSL hydrolase family protein [Actinomycetota bacterium]|nr:SGNH/GDSL hydrolase family protein [Actinomycetota bacterium]
MTPGRLLRRALVGLGTGVTAFAGLMVAEVLVARRGPAPSPGPPLPQGMPAGPPGVPTDTVVWLGDSTAAGLGASSLDGTVAVRTAGLLGRPVALTVLGHSGDRVAHVLHSQLPRLAAARPTVVMISIGANDVTHLTRRSAFRRDYAALLAGLPPVRQVVVVGIPDMGTSPRVPQPLRAIAGWRGRRMNADVRRLAARSGAIYADVAARTGQAFRDHPERYFAHDRYHPDDEGYALWAAAIASAVRDGSQPTGDGPAR